MRPRQKIFKWNIPLNTPDKALNTARFAHWTRKSYVFARLLAYPMYSPFPEKVTPRDVLNYSQYYKYDTLGDLL